MALRCEFGNQLEERLKDHLIAGCKSDQIRKRLYENEKTFQEGLQLARNLEPIERDLMMSVEPFSQFAVTPGEKVFFAELGEGDRPQFLISLSLINYNS